MSNPAFETVPLHQWYGATPNGDIALAHPFDGVLLNHDPYARDPLMVNHISNEPKRPPLAFVNDNKLGDGYGYWQGMRYGEQLFIGFLFTDPSSPAGLGDYRQFKDMASNFDLVVHSETQAVRLERLRGASRRGSIPVSETVQIDATYRSALIDAHPNVVDLAPQPDPFSGELSRVGRGLQAVRDAVIGQGIDQKDPSDPDLTYLSTDFIYANTVQWHDFMRAGTVAAEIGRPIASMLFVVSHEMGDIMRKTTVSSGIALDERNFVFARPEYAEDVNTRSYALALDHGYIPHEALEGTQF